MKDVDSVAVGGSRQHTTSTKARSTSGIGSGGRIRIGTDQVRAFGSAKNCSRGIDRAFSRTRKIRGERQRYLFRPHGGSIRRHAEIAFRKARQAAQENRRQSVQHKRELDRLHRQLADAKSERELAQIALRSRLREKQIREAAKDSKTKNTSDIVDILQPMRDPLEMIEDDL